MTAVDEAIEEFTHRRGELERDIAHLGEVIAHWDGYRPIYEAGPRDRHLMDKGLGWAKDLLSLKTAALARAAGDSAGSREWHDDAYAAVFGLGGIYSDWDLDTGRIDPDCAAAGLHQLVLCPGVLRKEPPAEAAFDALVELRDGSAVDTAALERIGRELARQLGRPVEVFVLDELNTLLLEPIALDLLIHGVCIYHEVQEDE